MKPRELAAVGALCGALALALLVFHLLAGCGPSACEKAGGHIEHRRCHTEEITETTSMDMGNGMSMPMTNTTRVDVCDHVCVGATAERP